jgi:hypothetical protein
MSQHNANVACVHMPRTPQWPAGRSPPRLRCSKRWASPPLCGETRSNPGDRWLRTPGPPHRSVPLRCIAFNAEWKEARA